ncbi:MAG TPA: hypothetical protein VN803_13010 [Gemmatimonadales bacterium]|nr:hypothetical protein [Gemmatimonadales bacterium]
MANEYALLADLKATLDLSGETFADADLQLALTAASRAIDNICERRFWPDPDATSVRYYTPRRSSRLLEIDDLIALTSFETDNDADGVFEFSWTVNTDFVLEPLNAPADGEPYTMVRVQPYGHYRLPGAYRGFTQRVTLPRTVKVTGQFGWQAVPDEIKQATMILAPRLSRRSREAPFGVIGFAMEGGSSAAMIARQDPDVMMLIGPYVRVLVF